MLLNLHIENYALIKELDLTPSAALNTITGETGAGKSIMLGALGLLLGNRADTKVLLDDSRKCIIEGAFNVSTYSLEALFEEYDMDYDAECIIRREISPSGKSRAFVNDGISNLEFLKRLGSNLMDVHSQHETLLLSSNHFQLNIIDAFAQNQDHVNQYGIAFEDYQEKKRIFEELVNESAELRRESDYHQFLFEELDKAQLVADEQHDLEEEVKKLENAEEIKLKLNEALAYLDQGEISINSVIYDLKSTINQISSYADSYHNLCERIESLIIELKDITSELESEESQVEYDPKRTAEAQEKLSLIYKLQQKHQVSTIQELLDVHESLGDKVLKVENLDEAIEEASLAKENAFEILKGLGEKLSKTRCDNFPGFETQLIELLKALGMPEASIKLEQNTMVPQASGMDKIDILFSANKGILPQSLKAAASGGEFSRLMFAIKFILADKTALPTIVFDEIDTGVSGEIAIKLAQMMHEMAANHQVITITHLPQIAAKGESHYFVYKDNSNQTTSSNIKCLSKEERVLEIAQMIGGKEPSQKAMESAKELMAL